MIQSMLIVALHPKMSVFLVGTNYTCENRQNLNQNQLNHAINANAMHSIRSHHTIHTQKSPSIYSVYLQALGFLVSITRAAIPVQSLLPAGLATSAEAQMLQAPSMLLGQAIRSSPSNWRWFWSLMAQPVRSEFLGAGWAPVV